VVQRGRRLRLAAEAGLEARVGREVGAQPLDRDDPTEPGVGALAHLGHPAPTQKWPELVASPDASAFSVACHQ